MLMSVLLVVGAAGAAAGRTIDAAGVSGHHPGGRFGWVIRVVEESGP
jgi:hypothetical protein